MWNFCYEIQLAHLNSYAFEIQIEYSQVYNNQLSKKQLLLFIIELLLCIVVAVTMRYFFPQLLVWNKVGYIAYIILLFQRWISII